MAEHSRPRGQTERGIAETFLDYVGVAGVALTALLTAAIAVGAIVLFVPSNETIGTVVFTGLLVAVVYVLQRQWNLKGQ